MSNEIVAYQPDNLDDIQRTASLLAASGYFTKSGDANVAIAQVATQIIAGAEMGMAPFTAVQSIHIIQGKPTLSANAMAAAVKAHPKYDYRLRTNTAKLCEIEFFENGESLGISDFSEADAKAAGTQNMAKFARNMLFARAMSNGVRWYCPDVFSGNAVYTPEELDGDTEADWQPSIIDGVDMHGAEPDETDAITVADAEPLGANPFEDAEPEAEQPQDAPDLIEVKVSDVLQFMDGMTLAQRQEWLVENDMATNKHSAANSFVAAKNRAGYEKAAPVQPADKDSVMRDWIRERVTKAAAAK